MNGDFEISLDSLPWTVRRGYRLPFSRGTAFFQEYFSVGIGGHQFLYSTIADLLFDIHFRAQKGILDFTLSPPGGQLPKYRVSVCRLWMLEEHEKFFIVKYTDSFDEACDLIRMFEGRSDEYAVPQGFGIHRFNPEAGIYLFDETLSEAVRERVKSPGTVTAHKLVFVSCNSRDYGFAERVYEMLTSLLRPAFFAQKSLKEQGQANFSVEIDRALEDSEGLIVAASAASMFDSPWFDQEWRTWINEYRSGRKRGNVMTVLGDGLGVGDLPIALRVFESRAITALSLEDIGAYF
jgi:hypothetical protein